MSLNPAARRPILAAAIATLTTLGVPAFAPDLAPRAVAQQAEPSDELVAAVEDFYHAAAVANYPAAQALGQELLARNADPAEVLESFRLVHGRLSPRSYSLDERLLQWSDVPELEGVIGPTIELINQGRTAKATDPVEIRRQVERLGQGRRAYQNGVEALRLSGEYAVPTMLDYLANPDQRALHADIRDALADLGLQVVSPLLAATDAEDAQLLAQVILVLGEIGYQEAVPYVLERGLSSGGQVQEASRGALQELGYTAGQPAELYLEQAERFYDGRSPIEPDSRFPGANFWSWENGRLEAAVVPEPIFNELMAMRAAKRALAQPGDRGGTTQVQDEAISLWLASNYRREAELPPGDQDPTNPEGTPTANYYGRTAGVPYLMRVIDRAIDDRGLPPENRYDTAEVILRAVRSLQDTIGESTLPGGETALTRAMNYPDRRVSIEAAMALAQALPTVPVSGSEQVVPLLADALNQTGQPAVLVVMPDRDALNGTVEAMSEGYRPYGATTPGEAVEQAQALPGVDVLVIDAELGERQVADLLGLAAGDPRLAGSAKVLLTQNEGSRFERFTEIDPTVMTSTAGEPAAIASAVAQARETVGGLPLDEVGATELAVRAADLLKEIGLGSSVFSLEAAEPKLLSALDDDRPDVQRLAAEVTSLLESSRAQQALLQKGLDPDEENEVRVAAFEGLAESAKRGGDKLSGGQEDLLEVARNAEDLDVRTAAAAAVGALSLPSDQARTLILGTRE